MPFATQLPPPLFSLRTLRRKSSLHNLSSTIVRVWKQVAVNA
jgi:hypothetical protein